MMDLVFTRWWMRSLVREVKKGKFKAIFRYFYDTKYRNDIRHICDLTTGQGKLTSRMGHLKLADIHFSHDINYPKWVDRLVKELRWEYEHAMKFEPIKVMYDQSTSRWVVIDGNHRLMAMKRVLPFYATVPVKILHPAHPQSVQALEARLKGRGNARLKAFAKQAHDPERQLDLLAHLDHGDVE